ncbi:MAG TPA: hypothetical protein DFS52_01420 [Myxococcales bacterium]|nr:hypothetical protein [Myxococcales bacterium]
MPPPRSSPCSLPPTNRWLQRHQEPWLMSAVRLLGVGAFAFLEAVRLSQARYAATYALAFMRDEGAAETIAALVLDQDEDPEIRGQAAEGLDFFGRHDGPHRRLAIRTALRGLRDRSPAVRFWCAFALGAMKHKPAFRRKGSWLATRQCALAGGESATRLPMLLGSWRADSHPNELVSRVHESAERSIGCDVGPTDDCCLRRVHARERWDGARERPGHRRRVVGRSPRAARTSSTSGGETTRARW